MIERVTAARAAPAVEEVALAEAEGRILARAIPADRDYPAQARSMRDGFAVRSQDTPGRLRVAGEVRAGAPADVAAGRSEAIEIMTGAPMPPGADAVVMVERARREGEFVGVPAAQPGEFVNPQASEARAGEAALTAGQRVGIPEIAWLAMTGCTRVPVFARPRVAVLATGDEIVGVDQVPLAHQTRNSNAHSLAAQVRRAGGVAEILPVAPDTLDATAALIERGLAADLLLLSGGVSAGKYDVVERALARFEAQFYFDRVLIRPGQPLVFGRARGKFFFGLPGNPASTMATFELFARAALELLGGAAQAALPLTLARLTADFRHKPGFTRFLPARLSPDGVELTPLALRGSSDIPALTRGNAYLVASAERESWSAGETIEVLPR